jgi:hypothetical protein
MSMPARLGFRVRDHRLAVLQFGNVTRHADEILVAVGFHFLQPLVLVVEFRVIGGNHLVTVIGKGLADCRAQAAHGAGYQCDFLFHSCCSHMIQKTFARRQGALQDTPSSAGGQYMC